MTDYITLEDVKEVLESHMESFESDFEDPQFGEKAKLLHKHYKNIHALLKAVKPQPKTSEYYEAKSKAFRNED